MSNSEIRYLGDMQRIERRPGDVFILSVEGALSAETALRIRAQCREVLGRDAKVLVLTRGWRAGVMGNEGTRAAQDVLQERLRQADQEGCTHEHDDGHAWEMTEAAICYAQGHPNWSRTTKEQRWPWEYAAWKPKDKRSNLVRAAALLIAEIERIDRAADRLAKGVTA